MSGVGGKTVEEAKANLSYREACDWFLFARQRSGLRHSERLLATVATQINHFGGGDAEIGDFLPHLKINRSSEQQASVGDVMNILSSAVL